MKGYKNKYRPIKCKSLSTVLLVTFSIALTVSIGFAQAGESSSTDKSNYAVLKGGIYTPGSNDLKGFGTGFNGEIAFGHYLNKFFATEIGIGYYQSKCSEAVSGSIGDDSFSGGANMDLWAMPVTVSLKALYPMQQFEPYAIGGIGAYFANAKFTYNGTFTSGRASGTAAGSESANATAFGGFLGLGANFNFDQNWYIGAEGKYLWTRPSFSFYGVDIKMNMDGWIVTGNVGYKF